MDQTDWVAEQVAFYHGVSKGTVRYWIETGRLEAKKARGRWVVDSETAMKFERPTNKNLKIPKKAYQEIALRYLDGETLETISQDYGVTRERIRQIIRRTNPRIPVVMKKEREKKRQARQVDATWAKVWRNMDRALKEDRKCPACGAWVIRTSTGPIRNSTCSAECSEAWPILRYFDMHEEHRKAMARSALAHPEDRHPAEIAHAKAVLSDDPPPPNRRFFVPGSKRSAIIKKYRPEAFKKIVEGPSNRSTMEDYEH